MNKYFDGEIPTNVAFKTEFDDDLRNVAEEQINEVESKMDEYHVSEAIQALWKYIARTNKYIDETAPWVLAKEEDKEPLKTVMANLAEALRKIAIMIRPFMPETSSKMIEQLGIDEECASWDKLKDYNVIKPGTKVVSQGKPLFVRLEKDEIEYIKDKMHS